MKKIVLFLSVFIGIQAGQAQQIARTYTIDTKKYFRGESIENLATEDGQFYMGGRIQPFKREGYSLAAVSTFASAATPLSEEFRESFVSIASGVLVEAGVLDASDPLTYDDLEKIFKHIRRERRYLKDYWNTGSYGDKIFCFLDHKAFEGDVDIFFYEDKYVIVEIVLYKASCINLLLLPAVVKVKQNETVKSPPVPTFTVPNTGGNIAFYFPINMVNNIDNHNENTNSSENENKNENSIPESGGGDDGGYITIQPYSTWNGTTGPFQNAGANFYGNGGMVYSNQAPFVQASQPGVVYMPNGGNVIPQPGQVVQNFTPGTPNPQAANGVDFTPGIPNANAANGTNTNGNTNTNFTPGLPTSNAANGTNTSNNNNNGGEFGW